MKDGSPFHRLTPAEVERLVWLSEECAETIQIISKILRHGYESTHPDKPEGPNNMQMLEVELGHIEAAKTLMIKAADIEPADINTARLIKLENVKRYLHHN